MDYFKDKVAIITGSARGIGFATARLLGTRGAKIVISDIVEDTLSLAEEKLKEEGIEVAAVKADVTQPEDCAGLANAAVERFGKIDILVNNAGISIVSYFDECTPETCKKLVDVNVNGSINMTIAALEEVTKSKGHIIFMSSVGGIRTIPTGSIYGASKAFVRNLGDALRLELKPRGVHVGVIMPGFTTTDASKTVMKGDGSPRPIDRSPHDTPEGVAKGIAKLIEKRRREIVLTPLGIATLILQRLSPSLLDRILLGRELRN